jgi:hypothetical protein
LLCRLLNHGYEKKRYFEMKAILILIVTVGSQGNIDRVDSSLGVQQIGFASLQACERAAARLNSAEIGRAHV